LQHHLGHDGWIIGVAITAFSTLFRFTRTSRYSSRFESASRKFASNWVFVYAG
jgi:hypothetical protein